MQQIYEAASDLEGNLQISGALNREIEWASKIKVCAETALVQSQSLDTNSDGDIFLVAIQGKFDPLQTCPSNFGLPNAEQWLNTYWNVVDKALCELNERSGAEERVSLKLLVQELCKLWKDQTGVPVTAHGQAKDRYTSSPETRQAALF